MEKDILIKKLTKRNIEDIVKIKVDLVKFTSASFKDTKVDERKLAISTRKFLKQNLNKNVFIFGGFVDNKLIATAGYNLLHNFPNEENLSGIEALICLVYVEENYRGKGLATELINKCLGRASDLGVSVFKLTTLNPKAVELYEELGFSKSQTTYQLKVKND